MLDQAAPPLKGNDRSWGLSRVKVWDLEICWLPRTCFLSGQQLWGQQAYHGLRWVHGPGEPVVDDYWIAKNEFVIWKLKGN